MVLLTHSAHMLSPVLAENRGVPRELPAASIPACVGSLPIHLWPWCLQVQAHLKHFTEAHSVLHAERMVHEERIRKVGLALVLQRDAGPLSSRKSPSTSQPDYIHKLPASCSPGHIGCCDSLQIASDTPLRLLVRRHAACCCRLQRSSRLERILSAGVSMQPGSSSAGGACTRLPRRLRGRSRPQQTKRIKRAAQNLLLPRKNSQDPKTLLVAS